jgi:hypothetical protein
MAVRVEDHGGGTNVGLEPPSRRLTAGYSEGHIVGAVFGLWDHVLADDRPFSTSPHLSLVLKGTQKAELRAVAAPKKTADER